ncbi:hypothetical protein, conserved [Leishmania tarentolae]|uniref:Uncharacterized protein n=1 Tax=Leishmania tarentolae TaxID=5689 RepID=A0A640KII8_LEITA|nr:hypothetical protein, conserved [Leishmania tarentolae]
MPGSSSFSSASTPPPQRRHSPFSMNARSRIDALFESHECASLIDTAVAYDATEGDVEDSLIMSTGVWGNSDSGYTQLCRSCEDTHRLRNSLKRIEAQYVAEIESLRLQLHEAVAQRIAAVRERNELLTSADSSLTHLLQMEQDSQSLRMEVVHTSQEKEQLRRRVEELEKQSIASSQRDARLALVVLEDAETAERVHVETAAEGEALLLMQLRTSEWARVATVTQHVPVHTSKNVDSSFGGAADPRCGGSCANTIGGLSPESASPVSSEQSPQRRRCSPRTSQRRSLSVPMGTRLLSLSPVSPRRRSEGQAEAATSRILSGCARALPGARAAIGDDSSRERIKRLEADLEDQRRLHEAHLAEERALTTEMQAEMDDLIENEMVLLEANSRIALEREWAESAVDSVGYLLQRLCVELCPGKAALDEAFKVADTTLLNATSVTCASASDGGSCEGQGPPTKKQIPIMPGRLGSESTLCKGLMVGLLSAVDETKRGVQNLHHDVARCHAAVDSTGPQQERVEALLHQLLEEIAAQRRKTDDTHSMVRRFARISTHNDSALFRAVGRVEKALKAPARPAALVKEEEVGSATNTENHNALLDPPRQLVTQVLPCVSAMNVTPSTSNTTTTTTGTSAADASKDLKQLPSCVHFVAAEENLFDPSRIHVDPNVAAQKMAALFLGDPLIDFSDADVPETPYDDY